MTTKVSIEIDDKQALESMPEFAGLTQAGIFRRLRGLWEHADSDSKAAVLLTGGNFNSKSTSSLTHSHHPTDDGSANHSPN